MDDMNRLLIFLLLIGLLYALYKYQHLIFGQINKPCSEHKSIKSSEHTKLIKRIDNKKIKYNNANNNVNIDNISQLSMGGSLDDEDGSPQVYKQDSILGSLDSIKSLLSNNSNNSHNSNNSDNSDNSNNSNNSNGSKNSSFFF